MKKRTLTLLEIMIVIFLITIITGAIGYNMKGALDKGKAFRTERAQEQLRELLLLRFSETGNLTEVLSDVKESLRQTGLAKDPNQLIKDGWGEPFLITQNRARNDITIRSKNLEKYDEKHSRKTEESDDVLFEEDDL